MIKLLLAAVAIQMVTGLQLGTGLKGFVPDADTAIQVAKPLYQRHFGKTYLDRLEPLQAVLIEDAWVITGQAASVPQTTEFEVYFLAIDRTSSRVMLSGRFLDMESVSHRLKKIRANESMPNSFFEGNTFEAVRVAWAKHLSNHKLLSKKLSMSQYKISTSRQGQNLIIRFTPLIVSDIRPSGRYVVPLPKAGAE
jgi:hypothetical protein